MAEAREWEAPFWVAFQGRESACVEAIDETEARARAKELTGCEVIRVDRLPYPADPRLNAFKHPKYGACPSFCFRPKECAGATACPRNYSCCE